MGYLKIKRFHLLISFGVAFFCLFFLLFQGKKDIIGTIVFCGFKKKKWKKTQKVKNWKSSSCSSGISRNSRFFGENLENDEFYFLLLCPWVQFFKKSFVAQWSSVRLAICRAEFESRSLWKGHRVLITHTERVFWENFNGTAQNWNSEKK